MFIFTSCGEDELKGVVLSEDPGYVKEPLVAIQAEDGTGNWINGLIDQNSRVIALDFFNTLPPNYPSEKQNL